MSPSLPSTLAASAAQLAKSLHVDDALKSVVSRLPQRVRDQVAELRARRFVARHDLAQYHLLPPEALKSKQREALTYLGARHGRAHVGDYLEFGVFAGGSMSCMFDVVRELGLSQVRLFGFDSFEGMPPSSSVEDEGTWTPGQFRFELPVTREILRTRGVDLSRVTLTKGWFADTLEPALRSAYRLERASVIMVDCDLFSSTVDVLRFCEPLIGEEAVLFFDDWNSNDLADKNLGERRAFDEFLSAHPDLTAEPFGTYADHAACFIVKRR